MYCAYCGVHYSQEDACLCLPPADRVEVKGSTVRVKGPWGEAVAEWSIEPRTGLERWLFVTPPAEA